MNIKCDVEGLIMIIYVAAFVTIVTGIQLCDDTNNNTNNLYDKLFVMLMSK